MPPRRRNPTRPTVSVLRIGHRAGRDPRLTTHLALAARALGADRLYLHPPDPALAERLAGVGRTWGGAFAVTGVADWRALVERFDGTVVHLTMYGEPWPTVQEEIAAAKRILLVVGGAKVPSELYRRAHRNVAVGHQPHSEVAALAVVLRDLLGVPGPGAWPGAAQRVVPMARGKKVVRAGSEA